MPYVTVGKENSDDIQLYYEDHGSGDPVVLIHGYPLNGASGEKQVFWRRATASSPMTAEDSANPASQQANTITTPSRRTCTSSLHTLSCNFALVGFSMGGGEVARYIGKHGPKGVSKAVIIGGVPPYLLKTSDHPDGVDAVGWTHADEVNVELVNFLGKGAAKRAASAS